MRLRLIIAALGLAFMVGPAWFAFTAGPARLTRMVVPARLALMGAPALHQPQAAWEQWQHLPGIVDLGARSDGSLVAMAAGHLYLVSPSTNAVTPFSTGPAGFSADPNAEPYFGV